MIAVAVAVGTPSIMILTIGFIVDKVLGE